MALLNFITQYKDVIKYKDLTASSPSLEGSQENDYVKLIFTKDGHISPMELIIFLGEMVQSLLTDYH